jgi:hypothetical protein
MKKLDSIFAWILLLLGCIHGAAIFAVFKSPTLDAIWFFTGGLAMIFGALLNLVRIARLGDRLAAGMSMLANLLLFAVFVIVVPWVLRHELKQNPQVFAVGLAVAAELFFSLKLFLQK